MKENIHIELNQINLTLFRIEDLKGWKAKVISASEKVGTRTAHKGAGCVIWEPNKTVSWKDGLTYCDGVIVVREWVGPEVYALAIIPRRVYFEDRGDSPTSRPERELVGKGTKPRSATARERLELCLKWGELFGEMIAGFDPSPMKVARERLELYKKTRLLFGGDHIYEAGAKVSQLLTRYGFYEVPENLRIQIVCEDLNNARARKYKDLMVGAFKRCGLEKTISLVTYAKMIGHLSERGEVSISDSSGYCALLAITGAKGQPLSAASQQLVNSMEKAKVPFRLFSLDNSSLNWSALDQVGSLLMGAGGIPYKLILPWTDETDQPYILGVDIGHPMLKRESWVVLSLLDSCGSLIESWRCRQKRDETIDLSILKTGLKWVYELAFRHNGGSPSGFLVVRDGRLHEGESVSTYKKILGKKVSFVELAKYDNPEMYRSVAGISTVEAGTEVVLAGAVTPFVAPVDPHSREDLSKVYKLHMAPPWDGLEIGMDNLSEIIIGLSYSAGLGLATHALPGPIYWADGIAAIGEKNHQFSGQKVTYVDSIKG